MILPFVISEVKMSELKLIVVTFAAIFAITESRNRCDYECPVGKRCVLRRSTCSYPPCPKFPICIDDIVALESDSEVERERPGMCPLVTSRGPCVMQCQNDGDCPSDEKCCFNGCGNTCRSSQRVAATKPGNCPRQLRHERICGLDCTSDDDCPGVEKCCITDCGSTCSRPCYYWLFQTTYKQSGTRSGFWSLPYTCRRLY